MAEDADDAKSRTKLKQNIKTKDITKKKAKRQLSRPEAQPESLFGSIPWKNVTPDDPTAILAGADEGGFMCLEEVDGDYYSQLNNSVEEWPAKNSLKDGNVELAPADNIIQPKRIKKRKKKSKEKAEDEVEKTKGSRKKTKRLDGDLSHNEAKVDEMVDCTLAQTDKVTTCSSTEAQVLNRAENLSNDAECEKTLVDGLPAWAELRLHWKILKALAGLNFTQPTLIQKSCIPAAAHQGKDVIGAAETGSGKTLAYVLPILQRLIEEAEKYHVSQEGEPVDGENCPSGSKGGSPLRALIVTPTRELSLQVCDHFRAAAKYTTTKVVPIVGGMSTQKQERLLKRRPEVVVGTPGRLWELMSAGEKHLVDLRCLSFFVLDEADRMVEKGHFQELQSIIGMLPVNGMQKRPISANATREPITSSNAEINGISVDGLENKGIGESFDVDIDTEKCTKRRQTFVFSATLALPPGFRKKLKKGNSQVSQSRKQEDCSVATLSQRAGVRSNAVIVNLTTQTIVAEKLEESRIQCREEEKEFYLYYLLKLHGHGHAIVFCTSIAAVRRVTALLHLLQITACPLHAEMQQRQRLKAMDRFRGKENGVLIATDVAARGLDIPDVRTVIHYQLPHSAEVYVHRSGRTARASKDGCSILLLSPSDQMKFKSLCQTLGKKDGFPAFPVNAAYMPAVEKRVLSAQKIDSLLRKSAQAKAKKNWFKQNADALGLDSNDVSDDEEEHKSSRNSTIDKKEAIQLQRLQQDLENMLEQPLEPRSLSHRFITGAGISPVVAEQLKDYAKLKMLNKRAKLNKKQLKLQPTRKRLVVIGQETVEPLAVLRTSTNH